MSRRSYGTGSLDERPDRNGRLTFYGRWRSNGRRYNRVVGPKRTAGHADGLTRPQAEARLREIIAATLDAAAAGTSGRVDLTIEALHERYVAPKKSSRRLRDASRAQYRDAERRRQRLPNRVQVATLGSRAR